VIVETYTHVCACRNAYMHEAGLWDGTPPGVPYTSPTDGRGKLAPGPAGEDREAAFRSWHAARYGAEHTDPCDHTDA
jgi:hypothetical protein